MKAVRFYNPGDIRYEEIPIPSISPDEILVKVHAALTCGTDLKTYKRGHPVLIKKTPAIFGHEFSGVIAKVGKKVKRFSEGMRVVCANSAPCLDCYYCHIGSYNLCENIKLLNGAYAEYIKVSPEIVRQNTLVIPDRIPFEHAALVEPLACVVHGIERSCIEVGDYVGILGAGPIGLMLVRLAKLKGARVIVVGRNDYKLSVAQKMGADEIINITNSPDPIQQVKDLTPHAQGVDVAIEAVGLPEAWEKALMVTRKGGLVNFFGGCEKGSFARIDTFQVHYEEKKLIGVFHHTPHCVSQALKLITEGLINPELLITHRMPLNEIKDAFDLIEQRKALKIALIP